MLEVINRQSFGLQNSTQNSLISNFCSIVGGTFKSSMKTFHLSTLSRPVIASYARLNQQHHYYQTTTIKRFKMTEATTFPPPALKQAAEDVAALLRERKETIAVAETAAGGLISAALLSTAGASAFYKGGLTVSFFPSDSWLIGKAEDSPNVPSRRF